MKRNLKRALKIISVILVAMYSPFLAAPYLFFLVVLSLPVTWQRSSFVEIEEYNPATGLPMDSPGGVDVLGNPYGCG